MKPRHLWMGVVIVVVSASFGWGVPQEATAPAPTTAQGSRLITFKGVVKDADGNPRTGTLAMTFSLYAGQEGGDTLWRENQIVLADEQGRYSVLLGSSTHGGLPPEVFGDGKAQWLGVGVDGDGGVRDGPIRRRRPHR